MAYLGREAAKAPIVTADLPNDGVTLAKMTGGTDGNIISYDASGDPVAIATGTDGQVLTSTGAGSPPAFEGFPAGHVVNVVVTMNTTDTTVTAAQNFMSAVITPKSASNKILFIITLASVAIRTSGGSEGLTRFMNGTTELNILDGITPWKGSGETDRSVGSISGFYYDTPGAGTHTYHCNVSGGGNGFDINDEGGVSSIVLMEIAA